MTMKTQTTGNRLSMIEKKLAENQFYGMLHTLEFFQQIPKMTDNVNKHSVFSYLNNAWNECKDNVDKRKLFFSIFFKHMDIANRDHNILVKNYGKNKADKGGDALRKVGIYQLEWMLSKDASMRKQFYAFLPLIPEYSNFENLFLYQLRTDRKKGNVIETISIIPEQNRDQIINEITDYLASKIRNTKTSDMEHTLISKFLPKPRFSKRTRTFVVTEKGLNSVRKKFGSEYNVGDVVKRKSDLQDETIRKEQFEADFIYALSNKLNWKVIEYPNNIRYIGLEQYKAKYNRLSEAYLFSSKEILKMDKEEFIKWLNQLPAGSRYRVQCRLFNKNESGELSSTKKWVGKFGDLADFYNEWLKVKESANNRVRELESKDDLSEEEKLELKSVKKDAKVNVAAESLLDVAANLLSKTNSKTELDIIADNIMRKIDIKVPVLCFVDRSGSMQSKSIRHKNVNFTARDMSKLSLTLFLLKNPNQDLQSIFGLFSSECQMVADYSIPKVDRVNRFSVGNVSILKEPIVDKSKPFSWNLDRVSTIIDSFELATSTDISSIPRALKLWVDQDPYLAEGRKELIRQFPVFLLISDGDLNNSHSPAASLQDFKMKMKQWFSADPVIVIWDVKEESRGQSSKFDNIDNTIYFGSSNPQVLNQVFCNIHDLDIIDQYIPLLTIYRTNRYELIRNSTN